MITRPLTSSEEKAIEDAKAALFIAVHTTGLVYCDRTKEVGGDYKRLGYLNYRTLELDIEAGCTGEIRSLVLRNAAEMQAKRGQEFRIAGNMTIVLGEK